MTDVERDSLIRDYIPLANKLAAERKKSVSKSIDLEDLRSAALYGLVKAAHKFNPALSVSFGFYAKVRIIGEIKDFIRGSYLFKERFCSLETLYAA